MRRLIQLNLTRVLKRTRLKIIILS